MGAETDIPSLTLRVLERIQDELVGLRGDVGGLRGEVRALDGRMERVETELKVLNTEMKVLNNEVKVLNARFDNFLSFVGKDVQDLKERLGKVETHLGFR